MEVSSLQHVFDHLPFADMILDSLTFAVPIFSRLDSSTTADNASNLVLAVGLVNRTIQDGQTTGNVLVAQYLSIGLHEFDYRLFCTGHERTDGEYSQSE